MIRRKATHFVFILLCILSAAVASAENALKENVADLAKPSPVKKDIIVNGDIVEYSIETSEVSAKGNVSVIYGGATLACDSLTVNTVTKEAKAEGNVRIEDAQGIISGSKMLYNFQDKTGSILGSQFKSDPYFGKAATLKKVSEKEFMGESGYATTCSLNHPHYRIQSKRINVFPKDKVQTRHDTFFLGNVPLLYLPSFNQSLKDPMMHVRVMPGKRKEWGAYVLTATRYSLADNVSGRIYLDYRDKLGVAEGFGANYTSPWFGKGDLKYYYTHERATNLPQNTPNEFERYLVRLRHKWDIDQNSQLTSELYKITDSKRAILGSDHNFLKDYFYREYEKDAQPLSYALYHRSFNYSSLDVMVQKRLNRWYSQLEKLPEVKYSLPSLQVGQTPLYFENNMSAANFNYKYAVPSASANDVSVLRFDTTNKIFLPSRIAFMQFTPYLASRQTFYDRDINGSSVAPRTVFYTGADISTKFYRIYNVNTNFLKLDLNGLRHVITPTIGYAYTHKPTVNSVRLNQIDAVDAIGKSNAVSFQLSNKLQTKRKEVNVDVVDLLVTTDYKFYAVDPASGDKSGGSFSDFLMKMKLLPFSWMRMDVDATYKPQGDYFSEVNPSLSMEFGKERSISFGHRYLRKGGKEMTFSSSWRLNPKWKLGMYERYQIADLLGSTKGLAEQQYSVTRDLHCWEMEVNHTTKKNEGSTIWLIFRLKAFPEMEFNVNQSYHSPQSGSQSNP
ncbi:MAG: LPS-assembly protein LptD [Candidatus Omnitrophota bacterium]|jgi:lipopolysaccharide assembly outer membrane protein LptD (OstA)|nr:MAG: LPS-assembly protein LptD [Candidatus Omnitrophota bacterium]